MHTLVFDRGNNSKKNIAFVAKFGLHYIGAPTPYQHRNLLDKAVGHFKPVSFGEFINFWTRKKKNCGKSKMHLAVQSNAYKVKPIRKEHKLGLRCIQRPVIINL